MFNIEKKQEVKVNTVNFIKKETLTSVFSY